MDSSVTIRGRDPVALLHYEAKRRPEVAAVLNDITAYTAAEIEAMPLPLPWIRNALLTAHKQAMDAVRMGRAVATIGDHIVTGFSDDPEGWLCEYTGPPDYYASVLVEDGSWVFVEDNGAVWFDTVEDQPNSRMLPYLRRIRRTTKMGYKEARREHLLKYHGDAPVIDLSGNSNNGSSRSAQPLAHLGVRIQRP